MGRFARSPSFSTHRSAYAVRSYRETQRERERERYAKAVGESLCRDVALYEPWIRAREKPGEDEPRRGDLELGLRGEGQIGREEECR